MKNIKKKSMKNNEKTKKLGMKKCRLSYCILLLILVMFMLHYLPSWPRIHHLIILSPWFLAFDVLRVFIAIDFFNIFTTTLLTLLGNTVHSQKPQLSQWKSSSAVIFKDGWIRERQGIPYSFLVPPLIDWESSVYSLYIHMDVKMQSYHKYHYINKNWMIWIAQIPLGSLRYIDIVKKK